MNGAQNFQVLVVGAGPVGMMAALELARRGVDVGIIDRDEGTTTRSYACLLHPQSVRVLREAGVGDEILSRGTSADPIFFAENGVNHELHLSSRQGDRFPVILPQSDLEEILQRRLAEYDIEVQWRHRLTDLKQAENGVTATINQLWESGKGYAVPHLDQVVRKTIQRSAQFVIGADGRDSHVRELLRISNKATGNSEYFAVYEFELPKWPKHDHLISLHDGTSNLFTRLPNGTGRLVAQCAPEDLDIWTHLKDRMHLRVINPQHDKELHENLDQLIQQRAPQLELESGAVEWHAVVEFPRSLVTRFGQDRVWLLGDAAHLASPIGMHSMNVGLFEAAEMAKALAGAHPGEIPTEALRALESSFRSTWEQLFGFQDTRVSSIAQCLPASGQDLVDLLDQLRSGASSRRTASAVAGHSRQS